MRTFSLTLLACLSCTPLFSGLNQDLNNFLKQYGSQSNVTAPEIYDGQRFGDGSFGGVVIKNRIMNPKFIHLEGPRFDAGCGGIDLYGGSFSFINHDEIVNTFKNIASNSVGYAAMLAFETLAPSMAGNMKDLNDMMMKINNLNINSCEVAASLVGAAAAKKAELSQAFCKNHSANLGDASDRVASRDKCSTAEGLQEVMKQAEKNPETKDQLVGSYNVAWEALKKQQLFNNRKDQAELIMTLMGTITVDEFQKVSYYEAKAEDEGFLDKLMNGGTLKLHSCGANKDNKCVTITEKELEIDYKGAILPWRMQIKKDLDSIVEKIYSDTELNSVEQELLLKSSFPLYNFLRLVAAKNKGVTSLETYRVSNMIAINILIQYLKEAKMLLKEGLDNIKDKAISSDEIVDYGKKLDHISYVIQAYEDKNTKTLNEKYIISQDIQLMEEAIFADLNEVW